MEFDSSRKQEHGVSAAKIQGNGDRRWGGLEWSERCVQCKLINQDYWQSGNLIALWRSGESNCIFDDLWHVHVQILQSVESDLKRYQQSVTIIGTSEDDDKTREEIIDIRTVIKNKLSTASNDIVQQQKS